MGCASFFWGGGGGGVGGSESERGTVCESWGGLQMWVGLEKEEAEAEEKR